MDSYSSVEGSSQPFSNTKMYKSSIYIPRVIKEEFVSPDQLSDGDVKQSTSNARGDLNELAEMLAQGLQAAHYKKLKSFSGNTPVPLGEEGFEVWKEHAIQCLQEWTCSEEVKRQRITESLRSPAAEIIRLHRDSYPCTSANEYVKVLASHYESYYDPVQKILEFRMSRQQEKETVSDFINRLQLFLSRLVYHKAIMSYEVDSLRTSQLVRGLLPHHPLTPILKITLSDKDIPIYELMMIVKKHEADLQFSSSQKPESVFRPPVTTSTLAEKRTVRMSESTPTHPVQFPSGRSIRRCHNCGEIGHISSQCRNAVGGTVQKVNCSVSPIKRIPKGVLKKSLIGPRSIINIAVNGYTTPALFDTGSQVTLIYRSFYQKYLEDVPLQSVDEMELWGLNEDSYPVDGSLPITVEIVGSDSSTATILELIAIVCPDPGGARSVPVILGTNCYSVFNTFQNFLGDSQTLEVDAESSVERVQDLCNAFNVAKPLHALLKSEVKGRNQRRTSRLPFGETWTSKELRVVDCLGSGPEAIPKMFAYPMALRSLDNSFITSKKMMDCQKSDPVIGPLYQAIKANDLNILKKTLPTQCAPFLRDRNKYYICQGLLYREILYHDHPGRRQLVLPKCFRKMAFRNLHDHHGHLGVDKTYGLVQDRFYWPKMKDDVTEWCRHCFRCLQRKTLPVRAAPMAHLQSSGPMDLVCIDFLCIDPDTQGIGNVLVVTDHFTRYAQAFPTRDQKALTVAKVLWEKYFIHYGLPNRLHSDQGRDFESKLIKELLLLLNIHKSRTTPYHPEGDALPERFNRTLLDMLGTLSSTEKRTWSRQIESLVHAYNCTRHDSTGFSPYFLMFGREPRLPVDLQLGVSTDGISHHDHYQYVARLKESLKSAYSLAERNAAKINAHNKRRYDLHVRSGELSVGDRVLLRNLGVRGRHKLANRWRKDIFTIVDKLPNLPVYKIQGPEGRIQTWHRNHLLPLPQITPEEVTANTSQIPLSTSGTEIQNDNFPLCDSLESLPIVENDRPVVPEVIDSDPPTLSNDMVPMLSDITLGSTLDVVSESSSIPQISDPCPNSHESDFGCVPDTLPQRDVRKGQRVRHPPAIFTYDSLGIPTLFSQPQTLQGEGV